MISYEVAENRSNESRSAKIKVGNAGFEISQPRSAYTYIPFIEEFKQLPTPGLGHACARSNFDCGPAEPLVSG